MKSLPRLGEGVLAKSKIFNRINSTPAERAEAQLALWVLGQPVHNKIDNECVPDFSCCRPDHKMAPQRLRDMFWLDESTRSNLLRWWIDAVQREVPQFAIECDLPGQIILQLVEKQH